MTTRQFVTKTGDIWEWEETPEVTKAVERLHEDIRKLRSDDVVKIYDDK
jgi:hypothetical protein